MQSEATGASGPEKALRMGVIDPRVKKFAAATLLLVSAVLFGLAVLAAGAYAQEEAFVATSPDFVTGAPASICSIENGIATLAHGSAGG